MIAPGPTQETKRLILRPTAAEDFEPWAAYMADPDASRFIGGPQERAAAWRGMAAVTGAWVLQGFSMFSALEKSTGRWVGRLGPWMPADWPGTEVGWGLIPSAQGQGYAVEGSTAAIDWAFDTLGWTEVIHCIDPSNTPSQRVAQRLGSVNRGPGRYPAPFAAMPVEIWGQTREQWRARRAA